MAEHFHMIRKSVVKTSVTDPDSLNPTQDCCSIRNQFGSESRTRFFMTTFLKYLLQFVLTKNSHMCIVYVFLTTYKGHSGSTRRFQPYRKHLQTQNLHWSESTDPLNRGPIRTDPKH
jgi:hypothetical protein